MSQIYATYHQQIWAAVVVTFELSGLAILFSLVGGSIVGVLRSYGGRAVNAVLAFPVDVLRSIPLLVVLVWILLAGPPLLGLNMDPLIAAVLGLSLVEGAYISEIVRGGLNSVRQGQMRAALALGMTRTQVVRRIVFPQAFIRMLPPIGSQVLLTFKDSTLASVIAAPELLRTGQVLVGQTFKPFPIFTGLLLFFLIIGVLLARSIDAVYRRLAARGSA